MIPNSLKADFPNPSILKDNYKKKKKKKNFFFKCDNKPEKLVEPEIEILQFNPDIFKKVILFLILIRFLSLGFSEAHSKLSKLKLNQIW